MSATVRRRYAVRPSSIVLTPPTTRVVDELAAHKRRKRGSRWSALTTAQPTPAHLTVAAAFYSSVPWLLARLENIALPNDQLFWAARDLMWGSQGSAQRIAPLFALAGWLHFAAAVTLVSSALLPHERTFEPVHAIGRRFYKYAIALPVWTLLATNLARFVADQVYSSAGIVTWNLTPTIAKLETPFIEWLQYHLGSAALSTFASTFYSAVWLAPIALAGFLVVAGDKPKVMNSLVVAYVLTPVLALPLFVLAPAFDPWTTNAIYGAKGLTTHIRYLYTTPPLPLLTQINTQLHWSAGSAFPSLQVAFPLVVSLVLRRHGMKALSLCMAGIAAMTMFVSVYLGRHWVSDTVAAIPFSFAVAALSSRIPLNIIVGPRHTPRRALRHGEVAVPSPRTMDAVQWVCAVCFISGFSALLYQIVW